MVVGEEGTARTKIGCFDCDSILSAVIVDDIHALMNYVPAKWNAVKRGQ